MKPKKNRRPPGSAQIRKEHRSTGEYWGYDVWIRRPDGSRKRYREFSFSSKAEASQALSALKTAGWKSRYGINPPPAVRHTTIGEAIEGYLKIVKASLAANRTEESAYWREMPGHLRTLQRWGEFAGVDRRVSSVKKDDFILWVASETERGRQNGNGLKKSTIRRGLKTIRAALNHAVSNCSDLHGYKVPPSPLSKK